MNKKMTALFIVGSITQGFSAFAGSAIDCANLKLHYSESSLRVGPAPRFGDLISKKMLVSEGKVIDKLESRVGGKPDVTENFEVVLSNDKVLAKSGNPIASSSTYSAVLVATDNQGKEIARGSVTCKSTQELSQ